MNWTRFLSFSLLAFSICFISCSKDDDNDGINTLEGCFASYEVDGQSFTHEDMALCVYLDNTLNLGSSFSGGEFQLQIDPITSTGTYTADISNPDLNVIILINLPDGTQIGSSNASITVTELSNAGASGTFSGTFFDLMDINQSPVYNVTNGEFSAEF